MWGNSYFEQSLHGCLIKDTLNYKKKKKEKHSECLLFYFVYSQHWLIYTYLKGDIFLSGNDQLLKILLKQYSFVHIYKTILISHESPSIRLKLFELYMYLGIRTMYLSSAVAQVVSFCDNGHGG